MDIKNYTLSKIQALNLPTSNSTAILAKLRRAIGTPISEAPNTWEFLLQDMPRKDERFTNAVYVTLCLYALHRQGKEDDVNGDINFATAISKIRTTENASGILRRFNAVATATDFSELAYHARGLVQLLKSHDEKMNYPQFANDLLHFQNPKYKNEIMLKWGQDFYRIPQPEDKISEENELI